MTPAEFKSAYPEFSSVSDPDIQRQLDVFALLYQGSYGTLADYLTGLFAAHQISVYTSNTDSEPVQNVTSLRVDDMSWKFEQSSGAAKAGDFAATKYGLEFHRLMSMFGQGAIVAGAVV